MLPRWGPMARTGVHLGQYPLHAGSVSLVLNTRTGHIYPQYYVVFDYKFSTVKHMRRGIIPVNCKNWVEEHLELATQEKFTLTK